MEMRGGMPVWRLVAATDMAAGAADPQMQPGTADLEAFLAAASAWSDRADAGHMGATDRHDDVPDLS
jgi:hypothetical protein